METPNPASPDQQSLEVKGPSLSAVRRARLERTMAKLDEEDLLDVICDHVACGGSVVDLCDTWDVQYHRIVTWVYDKNFPARKDAYESALQHRVEWMKSRILGELKAIGLVDIRGAYDDNGNLLDIKQMPPEIARVIAGVDVCEEFSTVDGKPEKIGTTKKLKLWDKLRAIELLGKNLTMFKEAVDHNHSGKFTLEDLVAGSEPPVGKPIAALPLPAPAIPVQTIPAESDEL